MEYIFDLRESQKTRNQRWSRKFKAKRVNRSCHTFNGVLVRATLEHHNK